MIAGAAGDASCQSAPINAHNSGRSGGKREDGQKRSDALTDVYGPDEGILLADRLLTARATPAAAVTPAATNKG